MIMAGQSLDEFVVETQNDILKFKEAWLRKHNEDPEHYPLTLPENNACLWFEFFLNFSEDGDI